MFEFDKNFCNRLAQLSVGKFNDLPKTGKPTFGEWTVLSSIGQYDCTSDKLEIVALGTGSKCIGATKMSPNGDILNDSHAEIICRRAFLRYLYDNIIIAFNNDKDSIFTNCDRKFIIRENISFHFFTSHVPCGDAAIFPKQNDEDFGNCVLLSTGEQSIKRPPHQNHVSVGKRIKIDSNKCTDIFRTGAKCLQAEDSKKSGVDYHVLGAVRTKPGRGDPTLSLSCSDKIAKWTFLGIQGALLTYFLPKPIYLSSFTVGKIPFSEEAFTRALQTRFNINTTMAGFYKHNMPLIGQAEVSFSFNKTNSKRPCPSSIIWSNVQIKPLEVSVDGKKQGVIKKHRNTKEGRLLICKRELFSVFINIVQMSNTLNELLSMPYGDVKKKSEYFKVWSMIKSKIFNTWTVKNPKLLEFFANE